MSVMRVGQLCGDTVSGIWNESEGWPLMIRTANEVGALPEIDEVRLLISHRGAFTIPFASCRIDG